MVHPAPLSATKFRQPSLSASDPPLNHKRGPASPFSAPGCAPAKLDYLPVSITSEAEFLNPRKDFSRCGMGTKCSVRPALRRTKTHERLPSRESSFRPALDRYAFQL